MLIRNGDVIFCRSDTAFVRKFGKKSAADMVLDFRTVCDLPFICDTYQLAYFLSVERRELFHLLRHIEDNYHSVSIRKNNGGERCLSIPSDKLKSIQKTILARILNRYPVSDYAFAYRRGVALRENAAVHCGKKYILKLDITDFFGSISFQRVYSCVFNTHYFPKQIGAVLTSLCCFDDALPQGAPTSPALSNIALKSFDDYIGQWCLRRGISYSRYCDDMTFSSDTPLHAVYSKVKNVLFEMGFELNEKKTVFVSNANRQTVTGLTVNEKVSVPSECKRNLRQEIYYALKFGLRDAIIRGDRREYICEGEILTAKYLAHLLGKISYILQIEPNNTYFVSAKEKLLLLEQSGSCA